MSWLQNLAKKGENFLDQLDQQAGAAIEQAETKIQKLKEKCSNSTDDEENTMFTGLMMLLKF